MSPVEFWLRRVGWPTEEVDIEHVFDSIVPSKKKVLLVENQEEYDYCWAMQMMMGNEIEIQIYRWNRPLETYLQVFSRVFTTWNPNDRNRI